MKYCGEFLYELAIGKRRRGTHVCFCPQSWGRVKQLDASWRGECIELEFFTQQKYLKCWKWSSHTNPSLEISIINKNSLFLIQN
jgi:hypothetical protein